MQLIELERFHAQTAIGTEGWRSRKPSKRNYTRQNQETRPNSKGPASFDRPRPVTRDFAGYGEAVFDFQWFTLWPRVPLSVLLADRRHGRRNEKGETDEKSDNILGTSSRILFDVSPGFSSGSKDGRYEDRHGLFEPRCESRSFQNCCR
jgi:hypothetical protein